MPRKTMMNAKDVPAAAAAAIQPTGSGPIGPVSICSMKVLFHPGSLGSRRLFQDTMEQYL
jgi:hypothetical protein